MSRNMESSLKVDVIDPFLKILSELIRSAALALVESFKIQSKIEPQKKVLSIAERLKKDIEEELEEINKIVH